MHKNSALHTVFRALAALVVLLATALAPSVAHAMGSVTIKDRSPHESDGRWKLFMTMNVGKAPDMPDVPMIFEFTPVVLYERALEDKTGDKPQLIRKPLQNQQPINESMDVGFGNATGKIFPTTKFDFVLRRDRGYEAGEYDLVIRRESDGVQIGAKQHIVLNGDNPIVDRRAIVFAGEKKKEKKAEDKPAGDDAAKADAAASAEPAADSAPAGDSAAADAPAEAPAPPPVPPKQGGCGCHLAGDDVPGAPAALALAVLGAAVALRRRARG